MSEGRPNYPFWIPAARPDAGCQARCIIFQVGNLDLYFPRSQAFRQPRRLTRDSYFSVVPLEIPGIIVSLEIAVFRIFLVEQHACTRPGLFLDLFPDFS